MLKSSDRAYLAIRSRILSGDLPPGHQLKEEEIAEMCGVSRTPVREAMRRLETELFIRRSDSQRSYVSEWDLEDISEIFTLRRMLEAYAVRRAVERASAEQVAELYMINDRIGRAIKASQPDLQEFLDANADFHSLILDIAASASLASMLGRLVLQPVVHQTAMRYDHGMLSRSHGEHAEIVMALEKRDADWAAAVMSAHISRAFHAHADRQPASAEIGRD